MCQKCQKMSKLVKTCIFSFLDAAEGEFVHDYADVQTCSNMSKLVQTCLDIFFLF